MCYCDLRTWSLVGAKLRFQDRSIHGAGVRDVEWFRPDGQEMRDHEWDHGFVRCLGMLLDGQVMEEWGERGQQIHDDVLLLLLNAYWEPIPFTLPGTPGDEPWGVLVDTATPQVAHHQRPRPEQAYPLAGRSLVLLIRAAGR